MRACQDADVKIETVRTRGLPGAKALVRTWVGLEDQQHGLHGALAVLPWTPLEVYL